MAYYWFYKIISCWQIRKYFEAGWVHLGAMLHATRLAFVVVSVEGRFIYLLRSDWVIAQLVRQNLLENRTSCNSFSPDFHVSGTFKRHVAGYDWPMYRAIGRLRAGESYPVAAPIDVRETGASCYNFHSKSIFHTKICSSSYFLTWSCNITYILH